LDRDDLFGDGEPPSQPGVVSLEARQIGGRGVSRFTAAALA